MDASNLHPDTSASWTRAKNRIPRSGLGQTGTARMAQINLETLRDDLDACHLQTLAPSLESAASVFSRGHSLEEHCQTVSAGKSWASPMELELQLWQLWTNCWCSKHQIPLRQDVLRFGYDGLGRLLSVHVCLWISHSELLPLSGLHRRRELKNSHLPAVWTQHWNVRPGLVGLLRKLDLLLRLEATPHLSTSAVQKEEQQLARQAACLLSICLDWLTFAGAPGVFGYVWTLRSKWHGRAPSFLVHRHNLPVRCLPAMFVQATLRQSLDRLLVLTFAFRGGRTKACIFKTFKSFKPI